MSITQFCCVVCHKKVTEVQNVPTSQLRLFEYLDDEVFGVCGDLICKTVWDDYHMTDNTTETLDDIYKRYTAKK